MQKTRKAQELRIAREDALNSLSETHDEYVLWREVICYMKPGENLYNTLARLGSSSNTSSSSGKRISKFKQKQFAKKNINSSIPQSEDDLNEKKRKMDLESVTGIASKLCDIDIHAYEKPYEDLVVILKQRKLIDFDWIPGTCLEQIRSTKNFKSTSLYEYKVIFLW